MYLRGVGYCRIPGHWESCPFGLTHYDSCLLALGTLAFLRLIETLALLLSVSSGHVRCCCNSHMCKLVYACRIGLLVYTSHLGSLHIIMEMHRETPGIGRCYLWKQLQQLYIFTNMLYLISSITKKLAQIIQENF